MIRPELRLQRRDGAPLRRGECPFCGADNRLQVETARAFAPRSRVVPCLGCDKKLRIKDLEAPR